MDSKLLRIERVTKAFPGVRALDEVSLDLERGEIHAALGQNGAGKYTLMHILAGVVRPDKGRILMEGREVDRTPSRGQELGISIVHQELSVFPSRDVAENIFVGRLPTTLFGFVNRKTLYSRARKHLEALETQLDPKTLVRDLSFSYRQLVEIAKALSYDGKVLILDEPTSALSAHETGILLGRLKRIKERGIGIIYVTHRLREIFAVSDRITVLRDGRVVRTRQTAEVDADTVISMMFRATHHGSLCPVDPSHLAYQGVNYVRFIRDFRDRIYHCHMKDVWWGFGTGEVGVFGGHTEFGEHRRYWDFRSIGHGNVKFEPIIVALNDIGYHGPLSIEWEDIRMDRVHGATEFCRNVRAFDFPPSAISYEAALEHRS